MRFARMQEELFKARCAGCHGPQAQGMGKFPRLAGQNPSYIQRQLVVFRAASKRRSSPLMQAMAKGLTDVEIVGLAHYVASLNN